EEVSGRVAAQGEFGKEDQVGAHLLRAAGEFEDRARVPGKVPNGWIDLSQRDLHRMSLPRCGEDRSDMRYGSGEAQVRIRSGSGAGASDDDADGADQDLEVEQEAPIFDIGSVER